MNLQLKEIPLVASPAQSLAFRTRAVSTGLWHWCGVNTLQSETLPVLTLTYKWFLERCEPEHNHRNRISTEIRILMQVLQITQGHSLTYLSGVVKTAYELPVCGIKIAWHQ
jgi:hypothetical protein